MSTHVDKDEFYLLLPTQFQFTNSLSAFQFQNSKFKMESAKVRMSRLKCEWCKDVSHISLDVTKQKIY